MPRIPPDFLSCTFYLYQSVKAAKQGEGYGGTGFVVSSRSDFTRKLGSVSYGITNYHVAVKGGFSVVRLNGIKGEPYIFDFDPSEWQFIPNGDDIAAVELPLLIKEHAARSIPEHMFATPDAIARHHIGPGDDVFMIGRFMDHDGGRINQPAARFGNISVMPAPIQQRNGLARECYCIDLHSRSGYSGSPVFVYRTFGQDLTGADIAAVNSQSNSASRRSMHLPTHFQLKYDTLLLLLGIHCGHFPEDWDFKVRRTRGASKKAARTPSYLKELSVEGFSGMAIATPARNILELLQIPHFDDGKRIAHEALVKQHPKEFEALEKALAKGKAPPLS